MISAGFSIVKYFVKSQTLWASVLLLWRKCQICMILMIFFQYGKDIYNNKFDVDFLHFYYHEVCFQLNQLFEEKKEIICCIFHYEFRYTGIDPKSGKSCSMPLSQNIQQLEIIQIAQLKANNLPTPPELKKIFSLVSSGAQG